MSNPFPAFPLTPRHPHYMLQRSCVVPEPKTLDQTLHLLGKGNVVAARTGHYIY